MKHFTIIFSGRVQGVGFRYTTARLAERFEVTGWVRNEPDGTVRCEVQGEPDEARRFIDAIEQAMSGNIADTSVTQDDATDHDQIRGFDIRY